LYEPDSCEPCSLETSGETSRCVLPTNATHYLTNCTRARGFFGSLRFGPCDSNRSQKDRCVSRRLRSLQRGTLFSQFREVFVPEAWMSLRLSCFVTRLCASLRFFERLTSLERRIKDHFFRAAREGCASVMIRNQVPYVCDRALGLFSWSPVLPP
jgi:hypothetical protein